jgi:hypothetical protein
MNWLYFISGIGAGVAVVVAYDFYLYYKNNKLVEDALDSEQQTIVNIIEAILFLDIEYDDITTFVIPTQYKGVVAVKVAFHEEDNDVIQFAMVKGKEVTLLTPNEWAFILGDEGVRSVPCLEDLDDLEDGYFEFDDGEDD